MAREDQRMEDGKVSDKDTIEEFLDWMVLKLYEEIVNEKEKIY